jgi:hypothetical protein
VVYKDPSLHRSLMIFAECRKTGIVKLIRQNV